MKNLAHLLPILDTPSASRLDFVSVAPPPLQIVASNDFPLAIEEAVVDDPIETAGHQDVFQEGYDTGYALGLAQGRAQEQAEHAGKNVAMETFVAQARAQWTAEQAQRIADGVAKALHVIEEQIAACVERALRQLADEKMRARALEDFSLAVRDLLRFGSAGAVTVHAPADLMGALQKLLQDCPTLEFSESDQAQVWVRSGPTLIEARLDVWAKSLSSVE